MTFGASSRARACGEIVSVDSALVYRGLDIGAAKPDAAERKRRDRWERLLAMVRKGKVGLLEHFLEPF